jgi:asparagine synthase (glutamine-hydrolysing)
MCEAIRYRGPDHTAVHAFDGAILGMVRLAIIDIEGGRQPIPNEDETLWVVFNGEIYNYEDLRAELEARGHRFRSRSDTETIIHAYEEFGTAFVDRLRGMFAIAIWDTRKRSLILARDRLGEKPLYYRVDGSELWFASEIRGLLVAGAPREVDRNAAATFLALGYVPAPLTAYQGIRKLEPGQIATFTDGRLELRRYWQLLPREPLAVSYADAVDHLDAALNEAVRYCLKSDVEVAAFLSGGLDSSLITALMKKAGADVRSYSIGFDQSAQGFSEIAFAERVSRHLQTRHTTFTVTAQEAAARMPAVLGHYDEPNGEPTSMLVHLLCEKVAREVKVAMGGTGGDELFHGYPRHGKVGWLQAASRVPGPLASALRSLLGRFDDSTEGNRLMRRAKRFGRALGLPAAEGYRHWLEVIDPVHRSGLVIGVDADAADDAFLRQRLHANTPFMTRVLEVDTAGYLPEFQLTYMDRMSMANSLEVRSPLCDFRVAELAAALPASYRIEGGRTKRILKDVARRYLPADIVERPKVGFDAPVGQWFKSALREFLLKGLDVRTVAAGGLLSPFHVERLVSEHLSGRHDHSMPLWSVLSLECWHRTFVLQDGTTDAVPERGIVGESRCA